MCIAILYSLGDIRFLFFVKGHVITKILLHALGTITKIKKQAFSCKILALKIWRYRIIQ